MSRFEQAKYLSEVACRLDEMSKPEYTPDELAGVALCVDIMHGLAINMAGDRVSEIYSGDADHEVPFLRRTVKRARPH